MTMQLGHRGNSTHRSKAFVTKTKDAFGSMIKAFKSLEIIPSSRSSAFKPLPASNEDDDDLFHPSPPFVRRFASTSQLSGSSGSTAVASVASRQTHKTDSTATEYSDCLDRTNKFAQVRVPASASHSIANRKDVFSLSIQQESDDEHPTEHFDDEDDDDDEILLIRSKRRQQTRTGFLTSIPHNPFGAFLSQPGYKQPYTFPSTRRS
ncbi:hypothetical protein M407DRAFT_8645 [Tulasnella calospora MUT 4182]|uniref:Uncharacterized protein n=1 Tax=Tulasnella calospora MUT 4182 TaxID=1051891 RepID=A0A0C3QH52_9AGAM|nr:hypothetical protein M407DRAFT_8645 [Tulasnella calospora MUT 4182]